jgi:hypothetical protein
MAARDALTAVLRGLLRSRVGVALLLTGLVLAVVLVAQLAGGGTEGGGPPIPDGRPVSTVAPTFGDDGVAGPSPTPAASAGTTPPVEVAEAFATAWLDHRDVSADAWRERLRPHATEALTQLLVDVDPVAVPADRITGAATTVALSDMLVEVAWPVDTGVLRLRLIAPDGRWLVDWVAWDRP